MCTSIGGVLEDENEEGWEDDENGELISFVIFDLQPVTLLKTMAISSGIDLL